MEFEWLDQIPASRHREFFDFYIKEWWTSERKFDDMVQMLNGSDVVVGVCTPDGTKDGALIGFARVLTDYTFKAVIFDVIVKDDYRGFGLGTKIISHIQALESLQKVSSFELYCPDQIAPFYEALGFEKSTSNLLCKKR